VSATLERPKVPAEFRGLARLFRDEVKRVDVRMNEALAAIARPLVARLRRHPRLRHELIAAAVKIYHATTPAEFRLGEIEVNPDRDAFLIAETRATATWINIAAWNNDDATEPGVAVARFALAMRPGRGMVQAWIPRGIVSLHALARRLERGADRSHDALLADLAVLTAAGADDDRMATPSGGFWLGPMEVMGGTDKVTARARNVRTWVPE
jgi:hypothetical protein